MNEDAVRTTRSLLQDTIQEALTDDMLTKATKKFRDACSDLQAELEYGIQSDLAYNLAAWTCRMAEQAIEAMLKGDDATMRRYLSCEEGRYTGRDREHSVIRGKLFETGAIELRKQIVDAHAELLKAERILDLEDQLKSLVGQLKKMEAEKNAMWERVRDYVPS